MTHSPEPIRPPFYGRRPRRADRTDRRQPAGQTRPRNVPPVQLAGEWDGE